MGNKKRGGMARKSELVAITPRSGNNDRFLCITVKQGAKKEIDCTDVLQSSIFEEFVKGGA